MIAPHLPYAGGLVWANDFLPAYHQGTRVVPGKEPIPNVKRQPATASLQEMELGLAGALNRDHLKRSGNDTDLAARIKTFETAFQMQFEAPEAFDLSKETDETLALYGLNRGETEGFGWQCLVARSLPSAACASSSRSTLDRRTTGTSHWTWATTNGWRKRSTADRRPAGPELPRTAGRHAGGVDHGVRPDARNGRPERPRPPPGGVLVVASRRRRQARPGLRRVG